MDYISFYFQLIQHFLSEMKGFVELFRKLKNITHPPSTPHCSKKSESASIPTLSQSSARNSCPGGRVGAISVLLANFNRKFQIFHKNVITTIPATNVKRQEKEGRAGKANKRRRPKEPRGGDEFSPSRRFSSPEFMDFS